MFRKKDLLQDLDVQRKQFVAGILLIFLSMIVCTSLLIVRGRVVAGISMCAFGLMELALAHWLSKVASDNAKKDPSECYNGFRLVLPFVFFIIVGTLVLLF